MNNKKKSIAIIAMVALLLVVMSVTVFAAAQPTFSFALVRGQKSTSSEAVKNDGEQYAYVTPESGTMVYGDATNFRVRTASGQEATEYDTWTSFTRKRLEYTELEGVAGYKYKLWSEIASKSAFDGQVLIGVWNP